MISEEAKWEAIMGFKYASTPKIRVFTLAAYAGRTIWYVACTLLLPALHLIDTPSVQWVYAPRTAYGLLTLWPNIKVHSQN